MKTQALILSSLMMFMAVQLGAQGLESPRKDDIFYARKEVMRIDMPEKINSPLQESASPAIYGKGSTDYENGLVPALLQALKENKVKGLNPDDLESPLNWEMLVLANKKNAGEEDPDWNTDDFTEDVQSLEDPGMETENPAGMETASTDEDHLYAMESSVELLEDRYFDKNTGEQRFRIRYIRLVWTDPSETLPDKNMVCIPYDQATHDLLEQTVWKNRFNDAENRSVAEVLDLRLFNGYLTNISGYGVKSMDESAFRTQQLVEYEHNLWEY